MASGVARSADIKTAEPAAPVQAAKADLPPQLTATASLPTSGMSPNQALELQRRAGNAATASLIARQRQLSPAASADHAPTRAPQVDAVAQPVLQRQLLQRDPNLEQRVRVLEKQQAATALDLRWRAQFGSRLSVYRQAVYALTNGFQTAVTGFGQAHSDQAQAEALKDQVFGAIINMGAAGAAEPLLSSALGGLGPRLTQVVELVENPLVALLQGGTSTAVTAQGQTRQAPPTAPPPGMAGGDPMTFLTQNLQEVESRSQRIEDAFRARADRMASFTTDQWLAWDSAQQTTEYTNMLRELDRVALSDISQLEGRNTLAVKIELYFWTRWILRQYRPGVSGIQLGRHLAARMKALGVESLAGGVRFDTSSWIFMDHEPDNWDEMLANWAHGYSARLTTT